MLFFKTKFIGDFGEKAAAGYLKRNRYKILERNFQTKYGEIDIIAEKDDLVCFVEVKTRRNKRYGEPRDAVNIFKQRKIISVAKYYMLSKNTEKNCRFDVVEVYLSETGQKIEKIEHIENAFWC